MRHTAVLIAVLLALSAQGAFAATFTARVTNMTASKALADYPIIVRVVNQNSDGTHATVREVASRTGKDGEFLASNRSLAAVATLFTFCPPGPDARTNSNSSSLSSMSI